MLQPGARVLWSLRRRSSDVRCVLYPEATRIAVRVLQDRDLVLTEVFHEEWLALSWARVYADRLKQQGWFEIGDQPAGRRRKAAPTNGDLT
jgi:hypothetical protein